MKTASLSPKTEVEVWMRILHPDETLSPRVARAILGLSFRKSDVGRMHELSAKTRAGTLTPDKDEEMKTSNALAQFFRLFNRKLDRSSNVPVAVHDLQCVAR